MAQQLKTSSLSMHQKLRDQSSIIDHIDDSTATNEASVSRERMTLDARSRASSRSFFASVASLFFVALTFAFTYVFIHAFPKS
mmetsp:Transcript_5187/g.13309  ORF Transcript_5187/g.13309 Transcript_5187/m.13309 type:complete len:83 (+) Transcript_5187:256-504(+)